MLHVIEREHRVEQHEARLVRAVDTGAQVAEHRFEPRRRSVAEIPDRAAGKARQVGDERRTKIGHQPTKRLDERPIAPGRCTTAIERGAAVPGPQNQERILAKERIAPHMLASFHALQEKGVVGVLGDLQERRYRREQIGDDLLAHGHERAAPGQLLELVKRRSFHRV